ncbi:MAG: capreomycin acetyltransferase, partial [Spirosoma sp.]|nr:capreomycin acetyltransferase [Spirosoma sp.]
MLTQTTSFFDVDPLRADTPGCHHSLFMNSAGASLMPQPVVTAMMEYLQQEAQLGGYEVERLRMDQIARFYDETARLLNTRLYNIAYAYSATDAYRLVLSAIPFRAGDMILTTTNDYVSNQLAFLSMQQRFGIRLLRIHDLPNGDLDLTHLEELLQAHRPVLVAITHVPTNSGLVLPAEMVGRLCRQYGVWYLLDAAQSVGQLPLDVTRIQPDFLVATGRKFLRGPRNTGFLYVSDQVLEARLSPLFI